MLDGLMNHDYYTKYHILCHMIFDVIIVTFWMTLLMNKFTEIVMDDG